MNVFECQQWMDASRRALLSLKQVSQLHMEPLKETKERLRPGLSVAPAELFKASIINIFDNESKNKPQTVMWLSIYHLIALV